MEDGGIEINLLGVGIAYLRDGGRLPVQIPT